MNYSEMGYYELRDAMKAAGLKRKRGMGVMQMREALVAVPSFSPSRMRPDEPSDAAPLTASVTPRMTARDRAQRAAALRKSQAKRRKGKKR